MAATLDTIEKQVRYLVKRDDIVLSADPGLTNINRVYRQLIASFPWPEQYQRASLAATTTADTGEYTWDTSMPVFLDIKSVEINSSADDTATFGTAIFGVDTFGSSTAYTYKTIHPPPSEFEWDLAGRKSSQKTPVYYRRYKDGATNKIELRPAPSESGRTIRVAGIVEPASLTGGASTTIFLATAVDDAMASMLAAMYCQAENAGRHLQEAMAILKPLWGNERVTVELVESIANA